MRCTIVCECGHSLDVESEDRRSTCPECRASYAVTITRLRTGANPIEHR